MTHTLHVVFVLILLAIAGCSSGNKQYQKGFAVSSSTTTDTNPQEVEGVAHQALLPLETRPGDVLLTGIPALRLVTVYKVNRNAGRDSSRYIGDTEYHYNYATLPQGNNWHENLVPGLEAVYGYNMVNLLHYDVPTQAGKLLFASPVLIKTVYYPASTVDTLNGQPISRRYVMVSVYNQDTNHDGFVNTHDLRRIYLFDQAGQLQGPVVPENYSVFKSTYDPANDYMYLYVQLDQNNNGRREPGEPVHIFWVDLKNPHRSGKLY